MPRPSLLLAAIAAQILAALFFLFDAFTDQLGLEDAGALRYADAVELVLAVALAFATYVTFAALRASLARLRSLERQVATASGAFGEVVDAEFARWELTEAEREVAMLTLKGLPLAEIARMRGVREGTVKAQCAAIYRKAGVSGRHELVSLFVEELIDLRPAA